MEKMNVKGKNTIILILAILLIGSIGYIGYVKIFKDVKVNETNNNKPEDQESIINSELKNIVLFARKGTQLVANTAEGNEIVIYDFKSVDIDDKGTKLIMEHPYDFGFHYDYDQINNIIYLFLHGKGDKNVLASIDLTNGNGKYNPKIISKIEIERDYWENMGADYIAKVDNYIYFSHKKLYRYNLDTNEIEYTNIKGDNHTMQVLSYKKNIIYNIEDDIYSLNVENNQTKMILKNSTIGYLYGDLLVYRDDESDAYYSYNMISEKIIKISNAIGMGTVDIEYIVPFDDNFYSISAASDKIYMYNNNNIVEFHKFSCNELQEFVEFCRETPNEPATFSGLKKISEDKLLIYFFGGEAGEYPAIFDLKSKKLTKTENTMGSFEYDSILYIK